MSKASVYEAKTESFIQPILDSMNFELVDVEYVKEGGMNYLRAYIDKEGGITVDDCEVVARQMNEILVHLRGQLAGAWKTSQEGKGLCAQYE